MEITITRTAASELVIIDINHFHDERGFFLEPWNERDFAKAGIREVFVQEGHSGSKGGVIRGLHYQDMTAPMGKLVRCVVGEIFDVAVDLRKSSPTFGKWFGINLSAVNKRQWFVPVGFANGFAVISDYAEKLYKQTGYYTPSSEHTLSWDDPTIGVQWPVKEPTLSQRDLNGNSFKEYLGSPSFK